MGELTDKKGWVLGFGDMVLSKWGRKLKRK